MKGKRWEWTEGDEMQRKRVRVKKMEGGFTRSERKKSKDRPRKVYGVVKPHFTYC